MLISGLEEYLFTIGIGIGFVGTIVSFIFARKEIFSVFSKIGIRKKHLIIALLVALLFVALELLMVKPTQQLFFDDDIYQAGAVDLMHMGQAWMCNFGSPTTCFSGEIFHEPIGTSFNLAIGFAIFGISRVTAYGTMLFFTAFAVFAIFFVAVLLFKNTMHAFFAELLLALSPIVLIWAMPTTSDILMMSYSVIAVLATMLFVYKKDIWTFSFALFSVALLVYMKVDALLYIPILFIMYLILDSSSIKKSLKDNFILVKKNILNTKALILLLIFVVSVIPMIMYAQYEGSVGNNYGYNGTYIQSTCARNTAYALATGNINLQNFKANICANALFWLNDYESSVGNYYIIQPLLFTAFAILGIVLLLVYKHKRRIAAAIAVWFVALFLVYTAFYAGSVLFGVDWRFMLALIPPMALLGGFGIGETIEIIKKANIPKSRIIATVAFLVFVAAILYTTLSLWRLMSINPLSIQQAQPARLDEDFIYSNASKIPSTCLVFSFDPTLFIINNRSSEQFGDLMNFNNSEVQSYMNSYKCLVIDYGYWCYAGDGSACNSTMDRFTVKPIAKIYDGEIGNSFGLYNITGFNTTNTSK